jgi:hypothetical protein
MDYQEFVKLVHQWINSLPYHDPLYLTLGALGILYMILAFLAGMYITYDWWRSKKEEKSNEQ